MVKKLLSLTAGIVSMMVLTLVVSTSVSAAVLENASLQLSSASSGISGVTYTLRFTPVNLSLGAVIIDFCTTASGTCAAPVSGTVDDATLTSVSRSGIDVTTDWDGNLTDDGDNTITIVRDSADGGATGNYMSFVIGGMDNHLYDTTCTTTSSTSTCYARISTTAATAGSAVVDNATVTYTVIRNVSVTATVDPSFTLTVTPVDPVLTTTVNGTPLTAAVTPTVTTVPFGNLTPGTPKFASHNIRVSTNAVGGYSVTTAMNGNMTGTAYGSDIDPFTGDSAAVNTLSGDWTAPTGTTAGTNTGWLGVATDDTDVTGRAANSFFPLGTSAQTIANQAGSANSEVDLVVFGIEVNTFQQADSYSGTMRYNALPVF